MKTNDITKDYQTTFTTARVNSIEQKTIYTGLRHKVAAVILLLTMLASPDLFSQNAIHYEGQEILPAKIEEPTFVDFSVVFNSGNAYLKWLVSNETEDGLFVIERSSDNTNFETIAFKQRIGVPISLPILYCSIDNTPLQGTSYYRMFSTSQDGKHYYSKVITLETPQKTVDNSPGKAQQSSMNWGYEENNIAITHLTRP